MMQKCTECGSDLPEQAKFCMNCGNQAGMKKEVHQVSAEGLVGKVKEIVKDANVKRIVVKDDKGKVLLSIPVTWGAAGAVVTLAIAPWLAALGVIAGIVTHCTIEVEKTGDV
jgi:CBS domain-containing protein